MTTSTLSKCVIQRTPLKWGSCIFMSRVSCILVTIENAETRLCSYFSAILASVEIKIKHYVVKHDKATHVVKNLDFKKLVVSYATEVTASYVIVLTRT